MSGLLDRPDASDGPTTTDRSGTTTAAADGPDARRGLPVVTLGGDDVAAIGERIDEPGPAARYSLEKRTLFGGPLAATLRLDAALAVGPDAVIVADGGVLDLVDADGDPLRPSLRSGDAVGDDHPRAAAAECPALFSEVRRRDVVAPDTGETIGRVDRFVVDPSTGSIGSIRLDNVSSDVRFLSWRDVSDFGEEVVTVPSARVLRKPDGPREDGVRKAFRVTRKPVLDDGGSERGCVTDVEFDRRDGRVTALLTDEGRIAGARLRGVGPHAVVVGRRPTPPVAAPRAGAAPLRSARRDT